MAAPRLTDEQREQLLRDGFTVIPRVVPADVARRTRDLVDSVAAPGWQDDVLLDLYNRSALRKIMEVEMGPHSPMQSCQVAIAPAMGAKDGGVDLGEGGVPQAHVDGGWGGVPPNVRRSRILAAGRDVDEALHTWGSDGDPHALGAAAPATAADGAGGASSGEGAVTVANALWQDDDRRLSLGSYTALCGVCLNDQSDLNKGQFSVRKGAHESVEAFFQIQRDAGGPVGGGGPFWPRLVPVGRDKAAAGTMPDLMVDMYPDQTEEEMRFHHPDWAWPQLTPVRMRQGDGFIALHSLPHCPTPNASDDPRINVYFRVRRAREGNPYEGSPLIGLGASDHPDRALNGEMLEYNLEEHDPYAISIDKLCDHWSEWNFVQGDRRMQDFVAAQRSRRERAWAAVGAPAVASAAGRERWLVTCTGTTVEYSRL
eukprot:COSAG06_NODE_9078_length_1993_cov_1.849525_1_plen_427_part_00